MFDYLTKPLVLKNLAHQISRALESRALLHRPVIMNARAAEGSQEADLLVGQSMAMIEVYKAIGRIAAHQLPALITGESGTGKQLVARAIHQHGPRSGHPIWVIDCADHGPSELESMLNPAVENSIMRKAMHGTLLLKNLSAIHHGVQFKLVQLIREAALRQNQMVGLPNLIFTSGLQPEQLVEQKHVRPDLFYDLIGGTIRLPPLRSREGDLPLLVAYYLGRFANVRSVAETTPPRISSAAMQLLLRHRWPGNVTELKSVIRRALIETQGTILPSDFLSQLLNESSSTTDSFHQPLPTGPNLNASGAKQVGSVEFWRSFVEANAQDTDPRLYLKAIELLEQGLIGATFEYTKGNLSQAARLLGMTRVSLRKKSKPGARVIEDEENNLD